jgi:hypothetical protein
MKRTLTLSAAILIGWLGVVSTSDAQVFIRAPFVRVAVGDGVYVRAPFVNIRVGEPYPYGPIYRPPLYGQPPVIVMPPAKNGFQAPAPQPIPNGQPPIKDDAPAPLQPATTLTLDAFAKSFQPKAGSYEVTVLSPVTKQPTTVRFTLPEGTPRRVHTNRDSIEFVYGLRQWVRIEFDKDGAIVTSR